MPVVDEGKKLLMREGNQLLLVNKNKGVADRIIIVKKNNNNELKHFIA